MPLVLYHIFLWLYGAAIRIISPFNSKAKRWLTGRRGWQEQMEAALRPGEKRVWVHCASLGEFEQGRPVIEAMGKQYPGMKIVVSFFSPSGYEIRKDYEGADYVFYLPMDGRRNAAQFVDAIHPSLAVFVKYEFWYYYMRTLERKGIPAMLISAAFRPSQPFFKWYGGFFRNILQGFTSILVQDASSAELLSGLGLGERVTVAGDTRYDRVAAIASKARSIPEVELFRGNNHLLIGGSTWPADETLLASGLTALPAGWKMVLAPHEIGESHINAIQALFGEEAVLFSGIRNGIDPGDKKVLVIDNIGMLSALYGYGEIAYIGGGFSRGGIHNILEPAVFGLPVLFGPVYQKFVEANALVRAGYAFPVADETACRAVLQRLIANEQARKSIKTGLEQFMEGHRGATDKILSIIAANHWLS